MESNPRAEKLRTDYKYICIQDPFKINEIIPGCISERLFVEFRSKIWYAAEISTLNCFIYGRQEDTLLDIFNQQRLEQFSIGQIYFLQSLSQFELKLNENNTTKVRNHFPEYFKILFCILFVIFSIICIFCYFLPEYGFKMISLMRREIPIVEERKGFFKAIIEFLKKIYSWIFR